MATRGIIAGIIYLLSGMLKYFLPPLSGINAKEYLVNMFWDFGGLFSSFLTNQKRSGFEGSEPGGKYARIVLRLTYHHPGKPPIIVHYGVY
jgi:hypothetical protein